MQKNSKAKSQRMDNYMEELTAQVLKRMLMEYRFDFSQNALRDIKALALNRLWPMYTTSSGGVEQVKKMVQEDNIEKDVVRELRAAIDIVRTNSR